MRLLAPALLLLLAVSCSRGDDAATEASRPTQESVGFTDAASAPSAGREAPVGQPAPPPDAQAQTSAASTMLIRTGRASVEVRELGPAIARLRQLAAQLGGHVANTTVQAGRDQVPTATLELKLPAPRFDQAVNGLESLGRVEFVTVEAQDVGEQVVDVTARLANARRLEERLVSLLATRTGRLEDVLAVERELARVREEIERYQGRLRYFETRIAVSTLVVTVHEPHPVLGRMHSPIAEAFRDAWRNFVGFIAWLIAASGILIPVGVLLAAVYWAVQTVRRRRSGGAQNR